MAKSYLAAGLLLAGIGTSSAANYYLTGNDAANSSSFNSAGHWNAGGAPAPGNTYQVTNAAVNGVNMRTPTSGTTSFQGDSLTVGFGGAIVCKMSGTGTIIVTNLILNGGWMHEYDSASSSSTCIVGGNVNVTAASFIGGVSTGNNASYGNTLEFTAPISGSAPLSVSGSFNNGGDTGTVRLRGANPYGGTMTVSNGVNGNICSAVNRILQLANVDALSNATLNLISTNVNLVSFLAASNTAAFNIGGLAGTANQALADTAAGAVAVSIGGNNASTAYSGILSGSGSLTKTGSGVLALSGANSFTGNTVINAGALALSSGGSLASGNLTVAAGATFDVASQTTPVLAANQNLKGAGTVNGSLTTSATSKIYPGTDGTAGALTFNNNLTLVPGSAFNLDVGTSAGSGNDAVMVGGTLALNNTTLNVQALGGAVNLDTSADYVLITAASIAGTPNATVTWVGTQPANAGYFTIVSTGTQVKLHYAAGTPLSATGAASPAAVTRNQPTLLTFAVTPATAPSSTGITVTANLSPLGGSATQTFYDDGTHGDVTGGDGIYSFGVAVPANIAVGSITINGTVTDAQSRVATPVITLPVQAGSLAWNGGGADDNWSSNPNWAGGLAPGYAGDTLTFAGSTRLTPIMDGSYSASVNFDASAGSFVIGTTGGALTLMGGGMINNSANQQTLNLAIANGGNLVSVGGAGNIAIQGAISTTGGLSKNDNGALILNGTNTYTGNTAINGGTVQIAGLGSLGSGAYSGNITNNGTFQHSSSAAQSLSGVISGNGVLKNDLGTLILTGACTYTSNTIVSGGILQIAGSGSLGGGSYAGNITNDGTFQYSSAAAQTLSGAIFGSGGVVKDGPGTLTLNGTNAYNGATVVTAGNLVYNPATVTYPTISSLSISNAAVTVNANSAASLPLGSLALNNNAALNLNFSFGGGNPIAAAVSATSLSVPGTNIVINVGGLGAAVGQFALISYVGTPLSDIGNFALGTLPPGVSASLVNNADNHSIDLNVTSEVATTWVALNGGDGLNASSFESPGHWTDGLAPSADKAYYTSTNYFLRTPADGNSHTFAGAALSIDANAGRLLIKANASGAVITVNNLIMNGGVADYANGGDTFTTTLDGNVILQPGVTSYMGALGNPSLETFIVKAPISGGGNLQFGGPGVNNGSDYGNVILSGNSTYTGNTTVGSGALLVNGSVGNSAITVLSSAMLCGTGSINGPVTVALGGTLAPGIPSSRGALVPALATLTINNTLTLAGNTAMRISKTGTTLANDMVAGVTALNCGGTLTVTKSGADALAAGDQFTLFQASSFTGAFSYSLPTLNSGLVWDTSVNGVITVVATTSVGLVSSANPSCFGQPVTLTATVSASGTPTGMVIFMDGATPLGAPVSLVDGVATLTTSSLSLGDHSIVASYSGSASFQASVSGALTETVNPPPVAPVLASPVYVAGVDGANGSLIMMGTGGTPGRGYVWLTTTNVSLPLSQWATNSVGALDGLGAFSNSLPFSPSEPGRFFKLKMQ